MDVVNQRIIVKEIINGFAGCGWHVDGSDSLANQLAARLADCLAAWLADWLAGQLAGCLAGLAGWLVCHHYYEDHQ